MKTVTLSVDGEATRNRRSRMGITLVGLNKDDNLGEHCSLRLWNLEGSATGVN